MLPPFHASEESAAQRHGRQLWFGRMMVNAGESESCGIELGINGKGFNNHLSYNLSYGFTHAVFTDYTDSISTNGTKKAVSYKNNYIPFVPMHTLSGSLDYTFGLSKTSSDFTLTIGVNASAQGKPTGTKPTPCHRRCMPCSVPMPASTTNGSPSIFGDVTSPIRSTIPSL